MIKYVLVGRKQNNMNDKLKNDKLKNGNSLETQFWSDNVEIDPNSPLTKLIDKVWNSKEDYIPTEEEIEQFNKEMKEYHRNKNKKD